MKILYDSAKAQENKKRIDAKVAAENKKIRSRNKKALLIFWTSVVLGISATIFTFFISELCGFLLGVVFLFVFQFLLPLLSINLDIEIVKEELNPFDSFTCSRELRYPVDILFNLATRDEEIIDMWLEKNYDSYKLHFSYEDKNGSIQERSIDRSLSIEKSLSVSEPTADLSKDTVFIPYKTKTGNKIESSRHAAFPLLSEIYNTMQKIQSMKAKNAFEYLDKEMKLIQKGSSLANIFIERINKHYLPVLKEVVFGLYEAEQRNRYIQKRESLCLQGIETVASAIKKHLAKQDESDIQDDEASIKAIHDFALMSGDITDPDLSSLSGSNNM